MAQSEPGKLDPGLGVFTEDFFRGLVEAELGRGREVSLAVFHSTRLEEIRQTRGETVAAHLMGQLADLLRPRLRDGDLVGRLGPDSLAVLIPMELAAARQLVQRIRREIQENSRFPVSAGVAGSAGLRGGAAQLCGLARRAALEVGSPGEARLPGAPAAAAGPFSATLGARYQRLVLLNRMSLELFSDKPFPQSLASACNIILALTGAKHAAVYFCDDFGEPFCAHRHGDGLFADPESRREELEVVSRALGERLIVTSADGRRGWLAAPLLAARKEGPSEDGVVLAGYLEPQPPSEEADKTMLEIGRLLRSARLTQRNLQQQKTMAAVSEQSADAIFLTNLESRITSWNTSAERLFQYAHGEVVGRRPAGLLVPKDKLSELARLEEQALREGTCRFETVRRRKDESLVPVEGAFTLLKDEGGAPFGMVRVFRDITRRKEVERMKSEFVSMVSHELRTPLTAISGFAETIFDFWDELKAEQRREYLGIILSEARRLGQLVTNFLDISRLESGGIPLNPKEIDLEALCGRLSALFRDHPSKAGLEARLEPGCAKVWGDEDQIYRVLVNLCGNALKYSPRGGVVAVSARSDGGLAEIGVSDQGPGIPAKHRKLIFEKFYRVADPVSQKTPGTGLGLAICKSIVEAHGGRIWVASDPGRGTRFCFTVPLPPPPGAA